MNAATETLAFQAETRQLLDIVIHSLYSHKEIFLRELLSNASDALDKLKLEALQQHALLDADPLLEIELIPDSQARTLTVSDSGIGMTRDELIALIGTIAKSGTRELVQQLVDLATQIGGVDVGRVGGVARDVRLFARLGLPRAGEHANGEEDQ